MNRLFSTALLLLFIMLIITATSCSKSSNHTPANITLYNKPLNIIQQYITGNWKLIYINGGFNTSLQYYDSSSWQISATKLKEIYPYRLGGIISYDSIQWVKEQSNSGDSFYYLSCYYKGSNNINYIVSEIKNDTLIIGQYVSDGLYYHFIKQ